MFLKVERYTLKSLKTVLRHRGVYTGNNWAKIVDSQYNVVDIEDYKILVDVMYLSSKPVLHVVNLVTAF
jgi:hypothetical protein